MALFFRFCRFGEMPVSGSWATCKGMDYKFYHGSDYDIMDSDDDELLAAEEANAPVRKYNGVCVISLDEFGSIGGGFNCRPRDVINIMRIFLRGGSFSLQHVKREILFLWEIGAVEEIKEYFKNGQNDEIVTIFARYLSLNDPALLNFVLKQLKKNFGWNSIKWNKDFVSLVYSSFVHVGYQSSPLAPTIAGKNRISPLNPAIAEEYLRCLKEIKAISFDPKIIEKTLSSLISSSRFRDTKSLLVVFDVFAKKVTPVQLLGGAIAAINDNFLDSDCKDAFFGLLAKCDHDLIKKKRLYLHFIGLKIPFDYTSSKECLERYLDIVDDVHLEGEKPLRTALMRSDSEAAEFLIYRGANIKKALSHPKIKKLDNQSVTFARELKNLHNILRTNVTVKETDYRKYYAIKECVATANKFPNSSFATIQGIYDLAHEGVTTPESDARRKAGRKPGAPL